MRTVIIDDETKARSALVNLLKKNCPDVTVIADADGVKSGCDTIRRNHPDLVFLDIQLKDGTGFDMLQEVAPINFKVIFSTAYNDYAIKAFKFSAVDYLLKPINAKELIDAVEKTKQMVQKENMEMKMNILLSNHQSHEKKIVFKTTDSFYVANIKDIVRCEADGNYTNIHLNDGKKILISKSLKEFDDMFAGQGFFRVHQSHLINLSFLDRVKRGLRGGDVYMKDSSVIPIAFTRKHELMKILQEL